MIIIFNDYMEMVRAVNIVRSVRNLDVLDWLEYAPYMVGISDKIYKILIKNKIKFKIYENIFL